MPDSSGDAARPCIKCGRELPPESFSFNDKTSGERKTTCKECVRAYSRKHYLANRDEYIDRAKQKNPGLRAQRRALLAELKAKPCTDCGRTFPAYCMEFDHVNGRTITGRGSPEAISTMITSLRSMASLEAELAKTELVCLCCHRIRTITRLEAKANGR